MEGDGWQLCMQDLYAFCAYALLLQICIFMLFVSKASQYAHSRADTVQRVLNVFIAAVPTGAPTGEAYAQLVCKPAWLYARPGRDD